MQTSWITKHQWRIISSLLLIALLGLALGITSALTAPRRPPVAGLTPVALPTRTLTPPPTLEPTLVLTPTVAPTPALTPTVSLSPTTPPVITPTLLSTITPTSDLSPAVPPFPTDELDVLWNSAGGIPGVIVYDLTSGTQRYTRNENLTFSAASVIKLPIALTVYRLAEQGQLDLNAQISMRAEDIVGGTGIIQYDPVGTTYSIRTLCAVMIAESDNTATNMLIRHIGGFETVNTLMSEFGATHTRLQRFMMDMEAIQAGRDNLTSPDDIFLLLHRLEQGSAISAESGQEILAAMQRTSDQQKIPALLPPGTTIMHKVGSLPAIEHDVGIVQIPQGHRYIIVFMTTDLPTNQAGINAIAQASRLVFDYESQLDG